MYIAINHYLITTRHLFGAVKKLVWR